MSHTRSALALLLSAALAACAGGSAAPAPVQPGAPGEASRTADPAAVQRAGAVYSEADVAFIHGMIPHHAQALVMTELVEERTATPEIRLMAERIDISQQDEIRLMQRWLRTRGLPVPEIGSMVEHAAHQATGEHPAQHHAAAGHAMMPGMLTEAQLAELAAARGAEFDRLFLRYMIQHHLGALAMVDTLFAQPGGGQQGDIYQIAEAIATDQRIEIDRMQQLLARLG